MKLYSALLSILLVTQANAAIYECKTLVNIEPPKVAFTIDTDKQNHVNAKISEKKNVGCVVLNSQPRILTCYIGVDGQSASVSVQIDVPILAVALNSLNENNSLVCVKQ